MMNYRAGNYRCEVIRQGEGKLSTGTEYFELMVKPIEYLDGDDDGSCHSIMPGSIKFWLSEKAIPYSIRDLQKLGWDGVLYSELLEHDFTGVELEATVERNDQGYANWSLTYKPEAKPLDAKERSKLDRLFERAAKKSGGKSKVRKEAEAVYSQPTKDDDETPF